ncbi:ATP-binding cassette sub-family A member 3 like protein [Argiope bruennichi]|uniref:ATP-binding cassette sub-family A member 3 like protein n=1 Tax=Argiope bruennichi TaxID=94029 RepID=A0A8T0EBJ9_ARGBR|nr:ATP-binding cassette sub-family A member 3 like protein [Argiope bruennichi]
MYSIKSGSSQYRAVYDPLKMDISSVYGKTDGFYYSVEPNVSELANSLKNVLESNKVNVQNVSEPTHYVLNYGKDITKYYKKIVVGGAIDIDTRGVLNLTAWYNDQMHHAMPMSLLLMHTALLQNIAKGGSISMTNAPLPELQSGYTFEVWTGTSLLLMFLYGWSSIPFSYLASFIFSRGNAGFAAIVGFCAAAGVGAASTFKAILFASNISEKVRNDLKIATWFLRLFPTFSLGTGFSNLFVITYSNAICESMPPEDLEQTCKSPLTLPGSAFYKCCKELCGSNCIKFNSSLTWEEKACGRDLLFLFIDGFIYFGIVLLLETKALAMLIRLFKSRMQRVKRPTISQMRQESTIEDSEVLQEEHRIRHLTATQRGSGGEALVVSELTKVFKNFYAVKHLTFGIHQEECFGFLGVNGAGKTTTFRMLTGDCLPTEGNAFIQNSSLRTDLKKFQSYLGYCPQFDALIDRLTGREMLMLFGRLRGLFGNDLQDKVEKMIRLTDLTKHADKQTQFYSGGNKRKLSVALALIGTPPLILLDEPTAGVDPVSRRKIWKILAQARNNTGAAVLLTTHSMEESEALCNRLAIMVNGRFRCLGSIQQLKSKYGQGYTLIIKLRREDENNQETVNTIKSYVQSHLQGADLKDDHQGMLQYHVVNPSLTLSHLFKFMSHMKIQFQLEDYLISTTSLEQIFLTFARAQRVSGE